MSNKNESATVPFFTCFCELNKAGVSADTRGSEPATADEDMHVPWRPSRRGYRPLPLALAFWQNGKHGSRFRRHQSESALALLRHASVGHVHVNAAGSGCVKMSMGPMTRDPMGIYSIRVLIWSETSTYGYTNGANPSPIGYAGMGTF